MSNSAPKGGLSKLAAKAVRDEGITSLQASERFGITVKAVNYQLRMDRAAEAGICPCCKRPLED